MISDMPFFLGVFEATALPQQKAIYDGQAVSQLPE